jgi:hypothetical protein
MRIRKIRLYKYVSISLLLLTIWIWLLLYTDERGHLSSVQEDTLLMFRNTRKCNCSSSAPELVQSLQPSKPVSSKRNGVPMPATLLSPDVIAAKFKPLLTEIEKQTLYDTLLKVAQLLTENDIQYWIYGGTLLGAFRHEDFVPWDDDADVIVNDTKKREFMDALSSAYPKYGFAVAGSRVKVFRQDAWKINTKNVEWRWPYVDVSFFRENATHVWDHSDDQEFRDRIFVYSKKDTFPLRRVPLGPFWAEAPKDMWTHLKQTYPMGIYTCVSPMYHHKTEMPVDDVIKISCRLLYKILKKQYGFDVPRDVIFNSSIFKNLSFS